MELGLKHVTQPMVAITGTNGKTTVTALTEHVLKTAGRKAKAVGNIGLALTKYLLNPDPEEILVVELSSYQLDHLKGPFFKAGTILNITPDHLDRYNDFSSYAESKANLQFCLQEDGRLYLPEKVLNEFGHLFHIPLYSFPEGMTRGEGMAEHDFCNAQASFALCHSFGISFKEFMDGFNSFTKPSHRIQFIKKIGGVSYFDDSKGTNIDATLQAVLSMKGPVILIAGGVDKGASYLAWKRVFTGKVRQIFAIGQAASKISAELSLFFNVKIVDSLENAVLEAAMVATDGDSVLLSPGCSSFDMFRDYAHRGREFQKFVGLLEERELV
jgi:UDP-N-acetylmuramoylalanine--D-glutamate ligase